MLRLSVPRAEGVVRRDGVGLHYQVFGDGPQAILLLPTWSIVHSDFWRYQVSHLAARYMVVAFDGRGNGASDRPSDPWAYDEREFADDALAVLDQAGVDEAVIMSVSAGAWWGLILAARSPERIPAAVFIAPSLPLAPASPDRVASLAAFDQPQESYEGWQKFNRHYWLEDWAGFLEFFFSKCFTEPDSDREIRHFVGMGLETTPEVIIATADAPGIEDAEAEAMAASLDCPVLVIHGDGDEISPLERGRELARLTGGELVVLPGSGHEPQCRIPAQVNQCLDEFLGRHYPASEQGTDS